MADVLDLDHLRTEWHERAVIVSAKKRGEDPATALANSRFLRSVMASDLRLTIPESKLVCEDGNGARMFARRRQKANANA